MSEKILIGKTQDSKEVYMPIAISKSVPTFSTSIYGAPGYGKSTLQIGMQTKLAEMGKTVVVLEVFGSLADDQIHDAYVSSFHKHLNSIDVHKNGIHCHLFEPLVRKDGTKETSSDVISSMTSAMGKNLPGDIQRATLKDALEHINDKNLYEEFGIGILGEVLDALESKVAVSVKHRLSAVIDSNAFLDGDLDIKEGKINVFRLSNYEEEDARIIADMLLHYIFRLSACNKYSENGLYIFIDECHKFNANKDSAIAKLLNLARKNRVYMILATQQPLPERTELGKRMNETGYKFYFKPAEGQSKNTAQRLTGGINSNRWILKLKDLEQGQFVVSGTVIIDGKEYKQPIIVDSFIEPTLNTPNDRCKKSVMVSFHKNNTSTLREEG